MCILACFFLRGRSFLKAPNDFEAALGPSGLVLLLTRPSEGISASLWANWVAERHLCVIAFWVILPHGAFLGHFWGAFLEPKNDQKKTHKLDQQMLQKRTIVRGKNGPKMELKSMKKRLQTTCWKKDTLKAAEQQQKQVLGAPCKLKMGISLGRGYKNEQWQLTCSRSLSAHKNSYF